MGDFTSRKRAGWKRSLPIGTAMPRSLHCVEKIEGRVKTFAQCMVKKRKKKNSQAVEFRLHTNASNATSPSVESVAFFGVSPGERGGNTKLKKVIVRFVNLTRQNMLTNINNVTFLC
jgi:hypothetical protein